MAKALMARQVPDLIFLLNASYILETILWQIYSKYSMLKKKFMLTYVKNKKKVILSKCMMCICLDSL